MTSKLIWGIVGGGAIGANVWHIMEQRRTDRQIR